LTAMKLSGPLKLWSSTKKQIPKVMGGMTTEHVLAMEYIEGTSLAAAMDDELQEIAFALGYHSAEELKRKVQQDLKKHFIGGGGHRNLVDSKEQGMLERAANKVAPLLRAYAAVARKISNVHTKLWNGASRVFEVVSRGKTEPKFVPLHVPPRNIDLRRVIKTLVMVHGVQVILDGVYNADPREFLKIQYLCRIPFFFLSISLAMSKFLKDPGNVIIMKDGRLGLIDYGMVGRLDIEERELIASTILAFGNHDKETVVRNYINSGYRASWINGPDHHPDVIHRFASFHLDRVDLSPMPIDDQMWSVLKLIAMSVERTTPDWIEQMKRLGGLLIGVASQAGRPISLSKEWRPLALKFQREHMWRQTRGRLLKGDNRQLLG
jgi:hypothetical protein